MDQSPIQIARERGHHDIVELISDWTLGAGSPPKAPGSTSPESQKSPNGHPTPPRCTTSPPNMIRPKMNNIAPKMSHIQRSQAHSQAKSVNADNMSGDPRKAPSKRKRKSCSKAAQNAVRTKINAYHVNGPNMNSYVPNIRMSQPMNTGPTLSPPRAEVPPDRLNKAPMEKTTDIYKGSLPILSDRDIIEGFSLFETQECFEDLPSNWVSGQVAMQPQSYNHVVTDLNMQFAPHNMHGARPKVPQRRDAESLHRDNYHHLVASSEGIESLNTIPSQPNAHMGIPNDYQYRNLREKQLQEQMQNEGIQSVMQHQFPTPPSVHSGAYMSSPGKSISPQDAATAASFLTPSPDSPKRSPGGWSTSPQSSESSVC